MQGFVRQWMLRTTPELTKKKLPGTERDATETEHEDHPPLLLLSFYIWSFSCFLVRKVKTRGRGSKKCSRKTNVRENEKS